MINIAALVALRDVVAATADENVQRAGEGLATPVEPQHASTVSQYPAKSLVLKDGHYHVAEHDK